jgi:integrase/recombinase XerD
MSEDLRLHDYRERTQEAYLLVVRQLVEWLDRDPEAWDEENIRRYFLYLREEKKAAPSSIIVAIAGIRFFVQRTLGRDWAVFELISVTRPQSLPVVLS